jgi:broad specificity phosphatase PhoE
VQLLLMRHGQGEHALDLPASLSLPHPHLTALGRRQVGELRDALAIAADDLFVVSPTVRTAETAAVLAGDSGARLCVSPLVGPRMFPQGPPFHPLACDRTLDRQTVESRHPGWEILQADDAGLWAEGINMLARARFEPLAAGLIAWCKTQQSARVLFVCHDGTINNYRHLLGETQVTRRDFLGDAGWVNITV